MADNSRTVTVRLSEEEMIALEKTVLEKRRKLPGHDVTKADVIREALIAQSYIPRARS